MEWEFTPQQVKRRAAPKRGSLADALFSRTQQRVLGLLFGQPSRSFFATEVIGLAEAGSGAVQRELQRLTESGLVVVTRVGNRKHYQANPAAPLFQELCSIVAKSGLQRRACVGARRTALAWLQVRESLSRVPEPHTTPAAWACWSAQ